MRVRREEVGGRQAQATQHRDESQGEVFIRSLDLTPTAVGSYWILSQAMNTFTFILYL